MIESWKDWTGARHIYLHIPYDLGLQRISLLKKVAPNSLNSFTYVVLAECLNVNTEEKKVNLYFNHIISITDVRKCGKVNLYVEMFVDVTVRFRSKDESGKISIRLPIRLRAS